MNEEFNTTPGMDKFFTRLLVVKDRLNVATDELNEIYDELNEIIKEKK